MKNYYFLVLFLLSFCFGYAQTKDSLSLEERQRREKNIQAGNPFKKFGYQPQISTLSDGKYLEFHDLDSIVRIGSFFYHVKKKEIIGYSRKEIKYSEATLRPEIISRWISPDPLSDEFPSWSPYTFTNDNPIFFTDPTGLAPETIYENILTSETVEVHDGINKTIQVSDSDFQVAKFFANEINPGSNGNGMSGISYVSREIADAYTSFYNNHNSYDELTIGNVMDALFVQPELNVNEPIGASGGLSLIGGVARPGVVRVINGVETIVKIQKHHIIPRQIFKRYKSQLAPFMKFGGGFNLKKLPTPFHGNHPQYNKFVGNKIRELGEAKNLTPGSLKALQKDLSTMLNRAYDSGMKINDYFRQFN